MLCLVLTDHSSISSNGMTLSWSSSLGALFLVFLTASQKRVQFSISSDERSMTKSLYDGRFSILKILEVPSLEVPKKLERVWDHVGVVGYAPH